MKRINLIKRLTAIAVLSLGVVSCNVDDSYDLSKAADNSSFGFGTDETSFDLPLMDVKISVSQLLDDLSQEQTQQTRYGDESQSVGVPYMMEIVEEITTLMPSALKGEYTGGVDISQLSDTGYTSGLVELFFDELQTNEQSRVDFAELVIEKDASDDKGYRGIVAQIEVALGQDLNSFDSADSCADSIEEMLNSSDNNIAEDVALTKNEVTDYIASQSSDLKTAYEVRERVTESIEIGEEVLDMLDKNLDGDKNTLKLLFTSETNLPFKVNITPYVELANGRVISIAKFKESVSEGEEITAEQFRELLSGLTFFAQLEINDYDPSLGNLDLTDKYILIKLIARKRGSLIL